MSSKTSLRLIGIVTAIAVSGVLIIVVPERLWTDSGVASLASLILTLCLPGFLLLPRPPSGHSDSGLIASIGPLSRFFPLLLLVSSLAIVFSFEGWYRASWALCLVWLCLSILGYFVIHASMQIVARAADQVQPAAIDARHQWLSSLQVLQLQADNSKVRESLGAFAQKIQYSANESAALVTNENRAIDAVLHQVASSLAHPEEVDSLLHSGEIMLAQREHTLRASRTRA